MLPSHGPWGGRCRPRDWGPGGGGEPGRGSRNLCWEERRGPGVRSAPFPRFPPPPGAGGAGAESAQPGRWMNVGENGDQDDRVRLGHVGGADGGKTGPHPLPPVPGGNLCPTKPALSSKLQRAREGGGSSSPSLSLPSLQFGGLSAASEDVCSSFTYPPPSIRSPEASAHSISLHRQASPPPSCRPLCASPCTSGYQASGLRSRALESPTVHTRKWREGNRAPSPHPPTLILLIWKELFSLLCCRSAVRVGFPWFRGPRGSGSSLDGRKKDKRGKRGG